MTAIERQFDSYVVTCYAPIQQAGGARVAASIACYRGTTTVGQLAFYLDTLPDSHVANDTIFLSFPADRFNDVYSVLRTEETRLLWFDPARKLGFVWTTQLPIAERPRVG